MPTELEMSMSSSTRLYISKLPNASLLEAYIAFYELPEDGPALQLLKAKCRELARTDSGVLVSPTHQSQRAAYGSRPELSVWIVAKVDYMKNPKTVKILSNLHLKLQKKVSLSQDMLQACYHFTLVARLAPKWNRVLSWLVQGCEFVTEEKGQGIDLQVGLTQDGVTITMYVYKISFSLMKVDDLLTTGSLVNTFKTDPHCVITESSIYNNRCFLLPNFTVGYIYSASHCLTPSREFQTYDQLRLHWKKQHGIILPENESLFYQVFFRGNPRKFFSYPGSCVYKSKPIHFPSRETDQVSTAFITDLHARQPTVCGDQVRYSSRALTPFASLQPPTAQNYSYANLKRLSPPKQTLAPVENIPSHLCFVPKAEPPKVIPTVSYPQQFKGTRVVPIFKPKINTLSAQAKTIPQQRKSHSPIIPKFKSFSANTNPRLPGKRQSSDSLTTQITKRPCLEPTLQVPNTQAQSTTSFTQSVPQFSVNKAQPNIKKLSITKRTQPKMLLPQAPQSLSSSSVAGYTQQQPSTAQTVPDMNLSLSGQLDNEDFTDFLPSKPTGPVKKVRTLSKTPNKGTPNTGTIFTGVSTDLVNKVNKMKAADLKKWLIENGVKCRSREKKDDMVRMMVQHITSTGKNFELTI